MSDPQLTIALPADEQAELDYQQAVLRMQDLADAPEGSDEREELDRLRSQVQEYERTLGRIYVKN